MQMGPSYMPRLVEEKKYGIWIPRFYQSLPLSYSWHFLSGAVIWLVCISFLVMNDGFLVSGNVTFSMKMAHLSEMHIFCYIL